MHISDTAVDIGSEDKALRTQVPISIRWEHLGWKVMVPDIEGKTRYRAPAVCVCPLSRIDAILQAR